MVGANRVYIQITRIKDLLCKAATAGNLGGLTQSEAQEQTSTKPSYSEKLNPTQGQLLRH